MPFTFAHPITVLPLVNKRYFHFPAAVLGAMSPDFTYFLFTKRIEVGHTIFSSEWFNLPLVVLAYFIYRTLLAAQFRSFLPDVLNARYPHYRVKNKLLNGIIFFYSAWLGMVTHIALDHLTHEHGYFVQQLPWLETQFYLSLYKWLQHGGSIIGLSVIFIFQMKMAEKYPYVSEKTASQKWCYWIGILLCTLLVFGMWAYLEPIIWTEYAVPIIRIIDSLVIVLIAHGIWYYKRLKHSS